MPKEEVTNVNINKFKIAQEKTKLNKTVKNRRNRVHKI